MAIAPVRSASPARGGQTLHTLNLCKNKENRQVEVLLCLAQLPPGGFFIGIALAVCTSVLSALSASKVLGQLDWIVLATSGLATLSTALLSQTISQKITKNVGAISRSLVTASRYWEIELHASSSRFSSTATFHGLRPLNGAAMTASYGFLPVC